VVAGVDRRLGAVPQPEPAEDPGDAVVEELATPTTLALFGSALVHPRVPVWAYVTALPVFALAGPLPDSPLTSGLHVLVGATLVWLSASLGRSAAAPPAAPDGRLIETYYP
jgi:hypothetical protein